MAGTEPEPEPEQVAWEDWLQETWQAEADRQASVLSTRCNRLRQCPLFGSYTTKQLRMLALVVEDAEYTPGEIIFSEGETSDGSVFILESGAVTVHIEEMGEVGQIDRPGETVGELALFLEGVRTATVRAKGFASLYRIPAPEATEIMETAWGGREALQSRAKLLGRAAFFQHLREPELMKLATALVQHRYSRAGISIVTEGRPGDTMYIVEAGTVTTTVAGVGRMSEVTDKHFPLSHSFPNAKLRSPCLARAARARQCLRRDGDPPAPVPALVKSSVYLSVSLCLRVSVSPCLCPSLGSPRVRVHCCVRVPSQRALFQGATAR